MAVLEFEFKATGLSGLTSSLGDLQNKINNINKNNNVNINTGNSTRNLNLASDSILGLRSRLNELLRTYGSLSEVQRNSGRVQENLVVEINRLREAVGQANREYDNLRRGTGKPIPDDSIVGMRNKLNELRKVYDNLSESQRNSTTTQRGLVTEINRLNQAVSQAEQATGRFQRNVGNYQQRMSGANGVTMEFNRIIQDAPFGMMGIGNNIQQLAANWQHYAQQAKDAAVANGTSISTMGLLRGAMVNALSSGNLLTLGIAAATSAWTYYNMQQQKAKKSTEEVSNANKKARESLDAYVQSMSSLTGALLKGEQSAEKELVRLRVLNDTYKNSNASMQQRKNSYNEMISMYESYFGKLTDEQKKVFDLGKHYDQLTNAIIKTAKARALEDEMVENNRKLLALEKQRATEVSNYNKLQQDQNDKQLIYADALLGKLGEENKELAKLGLLRQLTLSGQEDESKSQGKINEAVNKWVATSGKITGINKDNEAIYKQINEIVSQGAIISTNFGETTKNTTKNIKDQRDYLLEIQQILQNSQGRVDIGGEILDWDKELIKVHNYYDSQTISLDKMLVSSQRAYKNDSAKREAIEQAINSTRLTLHSNMINELSKIDNKYFTEGMAKIAELNAKYGESMDLDTRSTALKKVVDEFSKLREQFKNDPMVSQDMLDKWQQNQTLKVNWEFDNKDLEQWGKLNDKIQETIDKPFSGQNQKSIQAELEKRIAILKKLLEQLAKATGQPFDQAEFDKMSGVIKTNASNKSDKKQLEKDIQDYANILKSGVDNVFTNLKTNIDEFGWKAESVFYSLGETVGDMLKQVANKNTAKFMEKLTEGAKDFSDISKNFSNMWKDNKGQVIGAGLGMVGSGVSQLSSQSNIGGQAIGGALSGAGSMAATGNPYLIAGAAVVGALSGALNAAKNKKQERLVLKQLEEQKKANILLERLSALSYASQIIGQKTEYGIISGVKRNEFGEIVSVIQGKDIVLTAKRSDDLKNR